MGHKSSMVHGEVAYHDLAKEEPEYLAIKQDFHQKHKEDGYVRRLYFVFFGDGRLLFEFPRAASSESCREHEDLRYIYQRNLVASRCESKHIMIRFWSFE
ncbi:hypothetical protein AcV7_003667 [Taiwanofungus camphoratus]|nr:hypothetical protein AcV7_003667 [Antrodia cinnamomea]